MSDIQPVPPTLSLTQACDRLWDVVVVGAGPAGALAARELASNQLSVLLVDKAMFPRGKVCGCYLNGSALATLNQVGLPSLAQKLRAPAVTEVRFGTNKRVAQLPLPQGAAVSREAFDTELTLAAIERGAEFLPQTEARLGTAAPEFRDVWLQNGPENVLVQCRIAIVASGVGGNPLRDSAELHYRTAPRSLVGAAAASKQIPVGYQSGTIQMAVSSSGYVGCLQVEDGRLVIAAALDAAELRRCASPGVLAQSIADQSGLPRLDGLEQLRWIGTPPLSRQPRSRAGHRFFLVGDAAGYVEPFTGEGISWALASGRAVSPVVVQAVDEFSPDLIRQWNRRYHSLLGARQRICACLTKCLRRPHLASLGVTTISRLPSVVTPFVLWLNKSPHVRAV